MAKCTVKRLALVNRAFFQIFQYSLIPDIAKQIIEWDDEDYFVDELAESGHLDTAPRDYFMMAAIESLMPGKPYVKDGLVSGTRSRDVWHWPLNGSSTAYVTAFAGQWLSVENRPKRATKLYHRWNVDPSGKRKSVTCSLCGARRSFAAEMQKCVVAAASIKKKKR